MTTDEMRELRLGNIVIYQLEDEEERVGTIDGVGPDEAVMVEGRPFEINISKIKPIEIDEEWLVRFGFEMYPKWDDKRKDGSIAFKDLGYLFLSKGMMGGPVTLFDNQGLSTGIYIESVHELQNLTFAITGREPTIQP